jgi:hypothetical protein
MMIGSICENPLTIRAIIGWRDPLKEREMRETSSISMQPTAAPGSTRSRSVPRRRCLLCLAAVTGCFSG